MEAAAAGDKKEASRAEEVSRAARQDQLLQGLRRQFAPLQHQRSWAAQPGQRWAKLPTVQRSCPEAQPSQRKRSRQLDSHPQGAASTKRTRTSSKPPALGWLSGWARRRPTDCAPGRRPRRGLCRNKHGRQRALGSCVDRQAQREAELVLSIGQVMIAPEITETKRFALEELSVESDSGWRDTDAAHIEDAALCFASALS